MAMLSPQLVALRSLRAAAAAHSGGALSSIRARAPASLLFFRAMATVRPKDPERPKRPLSPYMRFLVDFRAENPDKKRTAVKDGAAAWKALQDAEKAKWVKPYEQERVAYSEAVASYMASGKADAWKRDPARPKLPMTAFLRFAQDYRQRHPGLKITEATKQAGAEWKSLPEATKGPLEQAYKLEKEAYTKALEVYKASGQEAAWKSRVGLTAIEDKAAEAKAKAAAKKQEEKEKAKKKAAAEKKKVAAEKEKQKLAAAKAREKKAREKKKLQEEKAKLKMKEALQRAKAAKEKAKEKEQAKKAAEKAKAAKQAAALAKAKEKEKAAKAKAKKAAAPKKRAAAAVA